MLLKEHSGLTLLELLLALSMVAVMGGVSARVLAVAIESWEYSRNQGEAVHNACWALDHIVHRLRSSNQLIYPNPYGVLAVSAMVDTDGDGLIDEDPAGDANGDGQEGVAGKDDDGDGFIDEGNTNDDDEDGLTDEDPVECWYYRLDSEGRLWEGYYPSYQEEILAEGVTTFQVVLESGGVRPGFSLTLGITKPGGDEIRFKTRAHLRDG
ncbi:MAG: hypothetical protein ACMUIA_12445 [bacterium]